MSFKRQRTSNETMSMEDQKAVSTSECIRSPSKLAPDTATKAIQSAGLGGGDVPQAPDAVKIYVVGGVAGGASLSARLRRQFDHASITMIDKGPFVSFANCGLPYYVGDTIHEKKDLVLASPATFHNRFRIMVRTLHEVTEVNREKQTLTIKNLTTGDVTTEHYDLLALATGAGAFIPPIPGVGRLPGDSRLPGIFLLRTIPDSAQLRTWVEETGAKRACVVGAAWAGLELAESLKDRGLEVTVLEMAPQVMPSFDPEMAAPVQLAMQEAGMKIMIGQPISGVSAGGTAEDGTETRLTVSTSTGASFGTDLVALCIGAAPTSWLAANAGLELGVRKSIKVDEHMRTSDSKIWAVGDVVESKNLITGAPMNLQLAGPANRQGRIAADSMAAAAKAIHAERTGDAALAAEVAAITPRLPKFRSVQATAVLGVCGMTVATTGISEKQARRDLPDVDVSAIWIHPGSHVLYYPGATPVHIKLVFETGSGKILGAQAVGHGGVEKRIDVISMAMQLGGTVSDLAEAELCYSPQYGAAKDPVNLAGMVATNVVTGQLKLVKWERVWDLAKNVSAGGSSTTILDGVSASCAAAGAGAGAGSTDGDSAKPVVVLDVRFEDEREAEGHLTGPDGTEVPVLAIPMGQVRKRVSEIPTDATIAVLCREGVRANTVARYLTSQGRDAGILSGGLYTSCFMGCRPLPARLDHPVEMPKI